MSIKARGRNGNFQVDQADVALTAGGQTAWVEVFSKKRGQRAPIMFTGDRAEVVEFFRSIIRDIEWAGMVKTRGVK